MLIPRPAYDKFVRAKGLANNAGISAVAKRVDIAPGIVAGRLQHDGLIAFNRGNGLKRRFELVG